MTCKHKWKFIGGTNCGHNNHCSCSASVLECAKCGDVNWEFIDLQKEELREECDTQYAYELLND